MFDEVDGVGTFGHVWVHALCESAEFIGHAGEPAFGVGADDEFVVILRGTGCGIDDGVDGMEESACW